MFGKVFSIFGGTANDTHAQQEDQGTIKSFYYDLKSSHTKDVLEAKIREKEADEELDRMENYFYKIDNSREIIKVSFQKYLEHLNVELYEERILELQKHFDAVNLKLTSTAVKNYDKFCTSMMIVNEIDDKLRNQVEHAASVRKALQKKELEFCDKTITVSKTKKKLEKKMSVFNILHACQKLFGGVINAVNGMNYKDLESMEVFSQEYIKYSGNLKEAKCRLIEINEEAGTLFNKVEKLINKALILRDECFYKNFKYCFETSHESLSKTVRYISKNIKEDILEPKLLAKLTKYYISEKVNAMIAESIRQVLGSSTSLKPSQINILNAYLEKHADRLDSKLRVFDPDIINDFLLFFLSEFQQFFVKINRVESCLDDINFQILVQREVLINLCLVISRLSEESVLKLSVRQFLDVDRVIRGFFKDVKNSTEIILIWEEKVFQYIRRAVMQSMHHSFKSVAKLEPEITHVPKIRLNELDEGIQLLKQVRKFEHAKKFIATSGEIVWTDSLEAYFNELNRLIALKGFLEFERATETENKKILAIRSDSLNFLESYLRFFIDMFLILYIEFAYSQEEISLFSSPSLKSTEDVMKIISTKELYSETKFRSSNKNILKLLHRFRDEQIIVDNEPEIEGLNFRRYCLTRKLDNLVNLNDNSHESSERYMIILLQLKSYESMICSVIGEDTAPHRDQIMLCVREICQAIYNKKFTLSVYLSSLQSNLKETLLIDENPKAYLTFLTSSMDKHSAFLSYVGGGCIPSDSRLLKDLQSYFMRSILAQFQGLLEDIVDEGNLRAEYFKHISEDFIWIKTTTENMADWVLEDIQGLECIGQCLRQQLDFATCAKAALFKVSFTTFNKFRAKGKSGADDDEAEIRLLQKAVLNEAQSCDENYNN